MRQSAYDGRPLQPGEDARPADPKPERPAADPDGFKKFYSGRLFDALALVGISAEELIADLRRKGIMTAGQSLEQLPSKIVDVLLDGKDKASGRDNWDIVVDRIKKARTA
jgi:hypothetical protein